MFCIYSVWMCDLMMTNLERMFDYNTPMSSYHHYSYLKIVTLKLAHSWFFLQFLQFKFFNVIILSLFWYNLVII